MGLSEKMLLMPDDILQSMGVFNERWLVRLEE